MAGRIPEGLRRSAPALGLSRKTYGKMVQNLIWATGYNTFAIPLAAGVAAYWGLLLTPAVGAVLMSASTLIVAIKPSCWDGAASRLPAGWR